MHNSSSYYRNIRPEVARLLPGPYHKVLEIGCGEGEFQSNLNQDCEYWGIEPLQAAAKVASNKLHTVLIGTYEEVIAQLPDSYFDLVICNDVIEHMTDHNMFFRTVKHKMKKGSFIIGSIPNVRYLSILTELLIKKDWMYKDEGILDKTHLRFFTEKSFKRTLIEHEFVIEEFHGIQSLMIKATPIKKIIKKLLMYIFGADIQFHQFVFRIKYSTSSRQSLQPTAHAAAEI